jgi:hypothetical protein
MTFISYKEWKQLNESMGHTTTLGIRKPQTIGELQSRWNEMGMMPMKSKKMSPFGGGGDEEMGDEEAPQFPPKKKKKKGLPPPPPEDDMDDMDDLEGDEDDLEGDEDDLEGDKDDLEGDEDDLEGDEDDLEGDEDDLEGDEDDLEGDEDDLEGDEDDLGNLGGDDLGGDDLGGMPPSPNPKDKHLKKGAAAALKAASHMIRGMKEDVHPEGCRCEDCKKCCKKSKKMTKEQREEFDFVNSLKSQCGTTFFDINKDGTFKEDAVFTPYDPNAGLENQDEPEAGEPGFAPQQRVGGELGSMAEWTKKYRRKINEAIHKRSGKPAKGKTTKRKKK